ncbi:MAG: polysaccharide deacetylase family protein, partial [Mycobacteriaceae bacterium]
MIWPETASFAVTVSVDVDGDLPLLAEDSENIDRHKSRSSGLYGPEHGAPRLLRMLNEIGMKAHWFFPGAIGERYPELVTAVHGAGHGIGVHGHHHLNFDRISLEQQIEEMTVARSTLESITGATAEGFRTPGGEWASGFPEAMGDAGFLWSSSLPS